MGFPWRRHTSDVDGDTFIRAESAAGEDEDTLEFLTADALVTINAAGRVGIGSTLPATNLDVNGISDY